MCGWRRPPSTFQRRIISIIFRTNINVDYTTRSKAKQKLSGCPRIRESQARQCLDWPTSPGDGVVHSPYAKSTYIPKSTAHFRHTIVYNAFSSFNGPLVSRHSYPHVYNSAERPARTSQLGNALETPTQPKPKPNQTLRSQLRS